ncbi:MAG: ankyrin repeat domain-containing protein [Lachnospiraceae bacterium]|nr:ankyrin repeat domain-containing protein [Lachnospiraceae bacterium]
MKEIKCSARTKTTVIRIGCAIVITVLIGSTMFINPALGFFMFAPGAYLVWQLLEYFHIQIIVDENGIEYKNCFNIIKKYEWKDIVVKRKIRRGHEIVFKIGLERVYVYPYYENYGKLYEWLLEEGKIKEKKKFKPSKKFVLCTAIITCILLVPISYHMYRHYAVGRFEHYLDQGDMEKALAQVEKMPDVNMLDSCKPIYFAKQVATMGAANRGYPLTWAAYKKADIRVMEALLEKGADPNLSEAGTTAFQELLFIGQKDKYEKIQLFLDYGADISSVGMYFTLDFKERSEEEKESNFRINVLLWESGVEDIYAVGTKYENTQLHSAVTCLDLEHLERLYHNENRSMEHLLNVANAVGETPIFTAVRYDYYDICEFLIEEGADLTVKNKEGKTAYDVAVELGYEDCARLLKEKNR